MEFYLDKRQKDEDVGITIRWRDNNWFVLSSVVCVCLLNTECCGFSDKILVIHGDELIRVCFIWRNKTS